MSFSPTNDASKDINMKYLEKVLVDWKLLTAFEDNKITFSVDCALFTAARDLYLKRDLVPRVNICTPHNFGNTSKRSMDQNLTDYWPDGPSKIQVIFHSDTSVTCLLFNFDLICGILGNRQSYFTD